MTFPIQRQFLDWHIPVVEAAAAALLGEARAVARLLDLQHLWVVVPTQHAGRRLREQLAVQAQRQGCGVLAPRLVAAEALVSAGSNAGSRAETLAVFAKVIQDLELGEFPQLFPQAAAGATQSFNWALGVAGQLSELRELLGAAGVLLTEMPARLQELDETDGNADLARWQELVELEARYLDKLRQLGLEDAQYSRRQQADAPSRPAGIEAIILVATPDPLPLALRALEQLRQQLPVTVLIHAPAELADSFDAWGRPLPAMWCERHLELDEAAITLLADASDQAAAVGQLLQAGIAPAALTVGVPDPEVTAHLERECLRQQIATFDPAGVPMLKHALLHFLTDLLSLAEAGDNYESLSRLLRNPDLLDFLEQGWQRGRFDAAQLLTQLDKLQNEHLPSSLAEVQRWVEQDAKAKPELAYACAQLQSLRQAFLPPAKFGEGILEVLRRIYAGRKLLSSREQDRQFADAAARLRTVIAELDNSLVGQILVQTTERHNLLLRLLSGMRFFPEPAGADAVAPLPLLGWLELHWADTPYLIVTGMNDGLVPNAVVGHPFLPDQARRRLGLQHNEQRLARDVYLLAAMQACRQAGRGELRLLFGKVSRQGDVLKPSRLLFYCSDEELPARAARLFGAVQQQSATVARTPGWLLTPPALPAPEQLAVTGFRDYLACPFRFYLKRVVGMAPLHDRKSELDAADFGNLCHQALQALAKHPLLRVSTDAGAVAAYLESMVQGEMNRQYGARLSLALQVQLESMKQRLRAAARVQAEQCAAGWTLLQAEVPLGGGDGGVFHGLRIRGRIDRIDRHQDGRIRVLDYKTSDGGSKLDPASAHLRRVRNTEGVPDYALFNYQGETWRWLDLQLPLYVLLLRDHYAAPLSAGFFNLPRAVSETAVVAWELDPPLLDAAERCAAGVVAALRAGVFWPPATHVQYDEFAALFFGTAADCVDPAALLSN